MRQQGRVVEWNDSRGFGFVVMHGTERRIFLHVRHFTDGRVRRPKSGDILTYEVKQDERGRPMADAVAFAITSKARNRRAVSPVRPGLAEVVVALFGAALVLLASRGQLPWSLLAAYAVISGAAFLAYRHDKRAAIAGRWRMSESSLQALALFCGWPGAWLAQKWLRHKSSKPAFLVVFWIMVALNLAGLQWFYRQGIDLMP
ncbi:hypothetical protein ASG87_04335 [Frateuria sp. Soil773]|uniref:DUF1294 domain-containing protein n=1 Tax=Frateuria sp. Soil773 TaxID=1736407 RepID=UPI0006F2F67C|nr:DUF1294 domain-containing protein [Frateuria sp. Soil773]KRE89559.1 hypothetical protein ASG87_04335 [Frateuria sp. Soil773]